MLDFIKRYKVTITFVLIVLVVTGIIFAIKYYNDSKIVYDPGPIVDESYYMKNYKINEYTIVNKKKEDVYREYYKEFMRLLANDHTKAFSLLTDRCKEMFFNNDFNKFDEYAKGLEKSVLLKSDVKSYAVNDNKIIIVDNTDVSYVFYENGVWNFKVSITR